MTVDLSKAVKGSKVYFRCGGEAIVDSVDCGTKYDHRRWILFKGYNHPSLLNLDGIFIGQPDFGERSENSPFDIIRITPPEFDWSTVKPGMAFYEGSGEVVWWVARGLDVGGSLYAKWELCQMQRPNKKPYEHYSRGDLNRAPEYDIEVSQ